MALGTDDDIILPKEITRKIQLATVLIAHRSSNENKILNFFELQFFLPFFLKTLKIIKNY